MKRKQGISLIVLVLTIIVIVILATAVILSIANNNPIDNAKKAVEQNNEATLKYAPTIPNGFVASQATGETSVSTGFVIYEGTEAVTDENVAIAKETRNQFVWVPVDEMEEFVTEDGYDNGKLQNLVSKGIVQTIFYYDDETQVEYDAMMASVKKYHGFYIARYEASSGAKFVANKYPISGGIYSLNGSRSLYSESKAENEKDAISTPVYGVQWDQTVRFIEKNYPNISKDSTGYGNYNGDGMYNMINTGSNEAYKLNNIYDMCGNVEEFTMEGYIYNFGNDDDDENEGIDYYVVWRGGRCESSGSFNPISVRSLQRDSYLDPDMGYRVALYIK